jgi:hypothetical protein
MGSVRFLISKTRVPFAARMATYRAYLINGDNRVSSYRAIDADTDADALTAAMWGSGISIARSDDSSVAKNSDQRFASWFPR